MLVLACACNKDSRVKAVRGGVCFEVGSDDYVALVTKGSVSDYTALPSAGSFTIEVAGASFTWSGLLSEWDSTTPLPTGNYTVAASYGEEGVEGFDKPYFCGQKEFVVEGAQNTEVKIPVSLANSIVKVSCSEMFNNYYPERTFTVTTGNGTAIEFAAGTVKGAFIDAYKFTISGELRNQAGNAQTFSKEYVSLEPKTCYDIHFDVKDISGGSITISFDESVDTVDLDTVELND